MSLDSILAKLGAGKKDTVCLSVTPGVGLELIQLDIANKTVKNYAYRPLQYDESMRTVKSVEAFKSAVIELFDELKINHKSNVILNVPMVLFGSKELPLMIGDDAVTEALTSEVEQSYIFKRYEPIVSWADSSTIQSGELRKLFYTAIQKTTLEDLKTVLNEIGANLVSVEMSLTSLLKALDFSGLAEEQMQDNITWNLMIINPNGYSICSMLGKNVVDYYDEPLALKSFEGEEIYNAINASAQITLMSYPANCLFIVSETDLVSAELLSNRLAVDGIIKYWDNNSFKKQDAIPVSLEVIEETAKKISLEAIGIAVGNNSDVPLKFNFLATGSSDIAADNPSEPVHIVLGDKEFDISPIAARNIAIAIGIVILIPALLLFIIMPIIQKSKQAKLDELNGKVEQLQAEVKRLQDLQNNSSFNVNNEIKKVLGDNRAKLMAYSALGASVPRKLWITYFVAKDDGKFDIKGESSNVEDVYVFFKNMKDSLINTQLRLHKLEMKSDSVDDAVTIDLSQNSDYQFEITNMTDTELNPPAADAQNPPANTPANPPAENNNADMLKNKGLPNIGEKGQ